jgi:hypothetical protein
MDWLAARLLVAVYDANRTTPEMSVLELKAALAGVPDIDTLTMGYAANGNQLITVGDRTIEVGPMASNEEIRLALENPFIRTENTKMAITGQPGAFSSALEKIRQRRAQTEAKFAAIASKAESTFAELDKAADEADKEIDAAQHELAQFTNGGP